MYVEISKDIFKYRVDKWNKDKHRIEIFTLDRDVDINVNSVNKGSKYNDTFSVVNINVTSDSNNRLTSEIYLSIEDLKELKKEVDSTLEGLQ